MSIFRQGEIELFYTDSGSGSTALLLHGWACDSHDWSWQIPILLESGFRLITVDHRGHGRSSAPAGDYHAQTLADDAAALMDHLGVVPELVIGHSMGTIVGSALSIQRPDLVPALVLVDPVYHFTDAALVDALTVLRGPSPCEGAAALFQATFYTPDTPGHLVTWHERRVLGTPEHVVRDSFLGLFSESDGHAIGRYEVARRYLKARRVPRLAVYATQESTLLERELPCGEEDEIHVVTGGHFLHQQRAEDFNRLLMQWLRRTGRLPSSPGRRRAEPATT